MPRHLATSQAHRPSSLGAALATGSYGERMSRIDIEHGEQLHYEQAARLLGVSRKTIERLVSDGTLVRGPGWSATVATAGVRATMLRWYAS